MKRKKILKKIRNPRSRTATTNRTGGGAAWKAAEREVAEYFNTTRTALGQAGQDLREVPKVRGWLSHRAPELAPFWKDRVFNYTHLCVDSKCDKTLIPILERWTRIVRSNPDPKFLKPLMVIGAPEPLQRVSKDGTKSVPYIVLLCRKVDLPFVFLGMVDPDPSELMNMPYPERSLSLLRVIHRFWMIREPKAPTKFIQDALGQVREAADSWQTKQQAVATDWIRTLPIVFLKYPKRLESAFAVEMPSMFV